MNWSAKYVPITIWTVRQRTEKPMIKVLREKLRQERKQQVNPAQNLISH